MDSHSIQLILKCHTQVCLSLLGHAQVHCVCPSKLGHIWVWHVYELLRRDALKKNKLWTKAFFHPTYKQNSLHQDLKIVCTKVQNLIDTTIWKMESIACPCKLIFFFFFALKRLLCFTAITFSLSIQIEISLLYLNDIA